MSTANQAIPITYKQEVRSSSLRPPTKPPHKRNNIAAWLEWKASRLRAKNTPKDHDSGQDLDRTPRLVQADATTILLNKGFHALISFCDYERVSKLRWRVKFSNGVPYAVAHVPGSGKHGKTVFMHRFILNAKPEDPRIDHWDGNGLNNTRGNLRFCTNAQNIRNSRVDRKGKNTSKLKGVYRMRNGKYRAQIMHVGRKINIGNFPTEEEAARAYDALARKLHGEFARVNFPQEAA